jgi:pimeloyl-ACP methyl ester carboxylesterase/predicted glycosyltransferase
MGITETGTRARLPDASGVATAPDGIELHWELHGSGGPTIVLLPATPISHSRLWKAQVHFLARHHRVLVYDGRGNGNSGSPDPGGAWQLDWHMDDCLAVMDATSTETAVLTGVCSDGVWPSVQIAARYPERVLGIVAIGPGVPLLSPPHPFRAAAQATWEEPREDPQGWEWENRHAILADFRGFLEFFFGEMFPEPHSSKAVEDAVAYGLDGAAETLVMDDPSGITKSEIEETCRSVRCPVLVVQGDQDNCQPFERGLALASLTGAEHVSMTGVGHIPMVRHPVPVNRLIHGFASRFAGPSRRTWVRAGARPRRALLVSSPIGLGHSWRDVAIARELRRLEPGLEIQWLAQPPVTTLLEECGETIHPASAELAPEAAHIDAEGREFQLDAFQALRRLDEIFCANFMVFHDVVADERFDVWIGDEAWEVDYFLHENPELKTAPYVWLTDFVGMLPVRDGDEREAFLVADQNAQMVEHVARHPRVRDRSVFIGDPEDVVPGRLGPGLPEIRAWTEEHYDFSGYVTGFDPAEIADRDALRREFGYGPAEKVCIVAAGGSAVGAALMRRAVAAFPEAKRRVPELRMIVVAGPRVDPDSLPAADGLEIHGYVHRLYRQLAACDLGISHGGLSTTMELTAAGRPFLFFPLKSHFEQNHHVAHRLARHGAGRRMTFDAGGPDELAAAIAEELGRDVRYQPVAVDGAVRAARLIHELL